jgi:hypothetical protein
MNEWEFTAEVASWINEILTSNSTLPEGLIGRTFHLEFKIVDPP